MKIATPSGHTVLNEMQWFFLVTFKSDIPKNELYELGDPQQTPSVLCGPYFRITSETFKTILVKKVWSQLMDVVSACVDREVIKYGRLQDEVVEWHKKCFESK